MSSAPRCGHTDTDQPERMDDPVKLTTAPQLSVDGVMIQVFPPAGRPPYATTEARR
jgi:hypothetical protein